MPRYIPTLQIRNPKVMLELLALGGLVTSKQAPRLMRGIIESNNCYSTVGLLELHKEGSIKLSSKYLLHAAETVERNASELQWFCIAFACLPLGGSFKSMRLALLHKMFALTLIQENADAADADANDDLKKAADAFWSSKFHPEELKLLVESVIQCDNPEFAIALLEANSKYQLEFTQDQLSRLAALAHEGPYL